MARPSKAEVLNDLHAEALAEFDAIQSAMHDERMQCLEDRRFGQLAGAQWEGALGDQFENKPRFEVNKVRPSVLRIENEYRNNRVGVVFQPKDGAPKDQLADTCAALFRADEQDSVADEAYDGAFDEAVTGGFGAFRLRGCYADEDDEDGEDDQDEARPQRIRAGRQRLDAGLGGVVDAARKVAVRAHGDGGGKERAEHGAVPSLVVVGGLSDHPIPRPLRRERRAPAPEAARERPLTRPTA